MINGVDQLLMLICIVPRGVGDDIADFLRENHVFMNSIILGKGTANAQWKDILGIDDSKKDILLAIIPAEREDELLDAMMDEFMFKEAGHGIAFTVDINSLSSKRVLKYCKGLV